MKMMYHLLYVMWWNDISNCCRRLLVHRYEEEVALLGEEMRHTKRFFAHAVTDWSRRACEEDEMKPGKAAYFRR